MGLEKFALTDRIAMVTGGSQGIGKAISLVMASLGAHVVVVARNLQAAQAVAHEVEGFGRRALVATADVTDTSQVRDVVSEAASVFGRVDILVNNAGGLTPDLSGAVHFGAEKEISEDAWDKVLALNLKSAFLVSKMVAPLMLQQKNGAIVNMCSLSGLISYPMAASYGAAKAGIQNFTESLAAELAPHVRVNAVAPGTIQTQLVAEIGRQNPQMMERRLKRMLLKRQGLPEEVAYAVAFLASDAASYITGETIKISGGLTTFIDSE
ncbi:MAG: SDR family oxidoreductase [Chloroflexi bacterium]|nr:SDR family oxidoreductase [Chloroflexota bacterium]